MKNFIMKFAAALLLLFAPFSTYMLFKFFASNEEFSVRQGVAVVVNLILFEILAALIWLRASLKVKLPKAEGTSLLL